MSGAPSTYSLGDFPPTRACDAFALCLQATAGNDVVLIVAYSRSVLCGAERRRAAFLWTTFWSLRCRLGPGDNRARRPHSFTGFVGMLGSAETRFDVQMVGQVLSGWV